VCSGGSATLRVQGTSIVGSYSIRTAQLSTWYHCEVPKACSSIKRDCVESQNWGAESDDSYFHLALLRKIKGEQHDRGHLIPCSNVTQSGINVKGSVERLLAYNKETKGVVDGPAAMTDEKGRPMTCRDIDDMIHDVLEDLFESDRSLFPPPPFRYR
jgi:hypothetical protein